MIKNIEEIIERLEQGTLKEYCVKNVELKEEWTQAAGKKISALSNSILKGPIWLCIGISDDGVLCGNDENWAKITEEKVSQHLNQYLDPQLSCNSVTCRVFRDSWFIIVNFQNPGTVVYLDKKAYKGLGTTIQEMSPSDIMELTISLPGLADYSAQPCSESEKLDYDAVNKFRQMIRKVKYDAPLIDVDTLSPIELLKRIGIANTRTSQILFGLCKYRVIYYDKSENPIRSETRSGLFGLIDELFSEEIQTWGKEQLKTTTNPYPHKALTEALANAVAHAAYSEHSGDIIIELFADKICISNLCIHESVFFANKWFSRAHYTVNRMLMETLRLAGYVDELGRGKNLIFAESLRYGKRPPEVLIDKSGRYDRWRLFLYGGSQNRLQIRLLSRLKELYPDEQKALVANALVLWRGKSVTDIRKYIDGDSSYLFAEILTDINGPIFYYTQKDQIIPKRWVSVLLGEGKDSKQLSLAEETDLENFARKIQCEYYHGFITPKELRHLSDMGHTSAERVLSSNLLKKWSDTGKVRKVRKGVYQFIESKVEDPVEAFRNMVKKLLSQSTQGESQ